VLRDTRCSTVVVRCSLVSDEKLIGQVENCILIDGTVRRVPVARTFVKTLYFTEIVMAVCMEDPICDLIIGNIQGAIDPQYKPSKGFFHRIRTNRRGQRITKKGRLRRNSNNKRQPDLNLREPSPKPAAVRLKLKLLHHIVKDPVNTVVHRERDASTFGIGKLRKSSLVINGPYCQTGFRTHANLMRAC